MDQVLVAMLTLVSIVSITHVTLALGSGNSQSQQALVKAIIEILKNLR